MKQTSIPKNLKSKAGIFSLVLALVSILILSGCAVTRKISAGEILSKTKLSFEYVALDSVKINKDLFPKKAISSSLLPNPQVIALVQDFARGILEKDLGTLGLTAGLVAQNQHTDTLWIKDLQATLKLDSLMELPVALKDFVKLAPGENKISVSTSMTIDKRIFKFVEVSKINIKGVLTVALDYDGEPIVLEFDMDRPVTHEEKIQLMDNARNAILNSIVNGWVGAIEF